MSKLDHALAHARRGWRVFPLAWPVGTGCSCRRGGECSNKKPGKHPLHSGWKEEATTDEAKVRDCWARDPEANVGIATGRGSNLIVLDVDGSDGEATVTRLGVPDTLVVKTGRGRQLYFQWPGERVRNKVGRWPQIDSRGDGGYVVAPGSLHASGVTYSVTHDRPVAPAPRWWLDAVVDGGEASEVEGDSDLGRTGEGEKPSTKEVKSGGRNSTLASMAGVLRDKGLSAKAIEFALLDYNRSHCKPPLDDAEVKQIAESYGKYEEGSPVKKVSVSELADLVRKDKKFLTSPIDQAGFGVRLMLYRDGVFRGDGADVARRVADKKLGVASRPDTITSVVELIKERTKVHEDLLNPKAMQLINTKGGMLDWREGKVHPHDSEHLSTFQVGADWKPDHGDEALDKFMREVFPPDALALAEELIGYLMIPTTKYQKAFMLVGEGANGKSTFLSVLNHFLGADNVSHIPLQQLEESNFAASGLQGKLANIYADLPAAKIEKSDVFKSIVSGDPISAERKYGQPFVLKATARLVFSANEFPRTSDHTQAFFRRWVIIPFPNKFEGAHCDPGLLDKLTTPVVMSALLARGVVGLRRLEEQRAFSESASAAAQVEAYHVESDSAYEFIKSSVRRVEGASVPKDQLYRAYEGWCQGAGVKYPQNTRKFNRAIETHTGATEKHVGTERKKCWFGIELEGAQVAKGEKF